MISGQKIRANRANARASTGPRTTAGKARASRNAKQHGLSLSVLADPSFTAELESLGALIAGDAARPELNVPACRIAAAQVDLLRVRQVRHRLLLASDNERAGNAASEAENTDDQHGEQTGTPDITKRLIALDRYERRAMSRRKRAIREFDLARR